MVKPGRMVMGKVGGLAVAIGAIAAAAYVFRYTNAGTRILESFQGAGIVAGKSILAPIEGLIKGVSAGTGAIAQESARIGSNAASFGEAVNAGDWASILDGSYVTKYGAPGDQSKNAGTQNNADQQPPKSDTKSLPTDKYPTAPDVRPTAPPTQSKPVTTTPKPTTPTTKAPTQTVQTRVTSPTTGIIQNKNVVTSTANSVKFRQNDGDIVYVSPSTAKALEARGTGKIVTSQNPTVQTSR